MTENERFGAINQHGERRTIVEWQHWTEFQPLSGPAQRVRGSVEFLTDDGLDVNANSDGTFTVIQTEEILTRI